MYGYKPTVAALHRNLSDSFEEFAFNCCVAPPGYRNNHDFSCKEEHQNVPDVLEQICNNIYKISKFNFSRFASVMSSALSEERECENPYRSWMILVYLSIGASVGIGLYWIISQCKQRYKLNHPPRTEGIQHYSAINLTQSEEPEPESQPSLAP